MPAEPRVEPGVAEQGETVHGDRDQARQGGLLVDRAQDRSMPGLFESLPAMVRPRPTEMVTRARATTPEARLASHQACSVNVCWPFMSSR